MSVLMRRALPRAGLSSVIVRLCVLGVSSIHSVGSVTFTELGMDDVSHWGNNIFFSLGATAPAGPGPPYSRGF